MSSVIFRIVAENDKDVGNPELVIESFGDIQTKIETELNELHGVELNSQEQRIFIKLALRLAAMGRNKRNFLQLLQRKDGIVINC